jgi:hypothetical protein
MNLAMIRTNAIIKQPSVFALLVDDISKMSASEQKRLWIKLNKKKLAVLAKGIDAKTQPSDLLDEQIASLVKRARGSGKRKKG